jgi:hypothetical protein
VNARDFVLYEARKPGGLVELRSRPDRQKKGELFENVLASEDGAQGEKDKWCFRQFNRKENVQPHYKPPRLRTEQEKEEDLMVEQREIA